MDEKNSSQSLPSDAGYAHGATNPGRLKIFFGYAAGVGKTYAMLEAAHQAQKEGLDVVVGYVEPHARPDTLALLEGLEALPCKEIDYRGIKLRELDLDRALQRKPQLILVDELAHNNAQGCRHTKRYQDVEELLQAGISVYTTVNVQHLESLNDLVSSITGIAVQERIPDHVFDRANQVELVDIEPDELVKRLQAGKVYRERQARQALQNFFTAENLAALREIAMRRTADQLNRTALQEGKGKSAKAGEHILICLSSAPSNAKVIRTAARMAEAFHSGFTALFVQTPETKELSEENLKRLRSNQHLAEQLGAQISTVYGIDPAVQIAEYARVSGVTKIVMGRINHKQNPITGKKSLADRLIELTDLDVYIIPDHQPLYKKPLGRLRVPKARFTWKDTGIMLASLLLSSMAGLGFFYAGFSESNIITVYILGVLITAVWTGGYYYGAMDSLLSVAAFNFLFTEPRFTFQANDPNYRCAAPAGAHYRRVKKEGEPMKTILLIGLGRFGRHTAIKLNELNHQVMAIDKDEERVNAVLPFVTNAQIGDSTSEEFLSEIGVRNFDVCIVAIGDNFQSSLETASLLKELGAKKVVARAARDVQAKFLLRNGADEVVYPEKQMAVWTAIRYSSDHIYDYIALGDDHAIFEIAVPNSWVGKTIGQLDVRKRYHVNIMAIKQSGKFAMTVITPDTALPDNSTILVLGTHRDIQKCFRI